jgi:cation diffusion facilitator family transporter
MSTTSSTGGLVRKLRNWFGVLLHHAAHTIGHSHVAGHGHTHGVTDPSIATTDRGIWAIKWSFVILAITAGIQIGVVLTSGSVALLADTIHNVGDATTAIPLWVAFVLARRRPTETFPYGYGRVEDIAGVLIVLIILFSAMVAGYEAIDRFVHPQPITRLLWVAIAGIVGFLGNEGVAVFRIRVGREINSAALIADGYHARTDGLTSLAVVFGAGGVWLGFPLADPIIGLLITIAIFGIVWQSAQSILTRMLDGVEPGILSEINHAAEHVPGIDRVMETKARWLGHKLHTDVTIAVDENLSLAQANTISAAVQRELFAHMPALAVANIRFGMTADGAVAGPSHGHHHAPDPVRVGGTFAEGLLEIVETTDGERMRLTVSEVVDGLHAVVTIDRSGGVAEVLPLLQDKREHRVFMSAVPPAEPHEFNARLQLAVDQRQEVLQFRMVEPDHHQ